MVLSLLGPLVAFASRLPVRTVLILVLIVIVCAISRPYLDKGAPHSSATVTGSSRTTTASGLISPTGAPGSCLCAEPAG
jgi:hypothetical protein